METRGFTAFSRSQCSQYSDRFNREISARYGCGKVVNEKLLNARKRFEGEIDILKNRKRQMIKGASRWSRYYEEEVPRVQIVDPRRRNEELQRRIDEAQGGDGRYRLLVRILLGGLATLAGVPSDLTLVTASVLSCWFVQEQLPTIRMFVRSDVIRRCAVIYT